jgi:hypothetical protein
VDVGEDYHNKGNRLRDLERVLVRQAGLQPYTSPTLNPTTNPTTTTNPRAKVKDAYFVKRMYMPNYPIAKSLWIWKNMRDPRNFIVLGGV